MVEQAQITADNIEYAKAEAARAEARARIEEARTKRAQFQAEETAKQIAWEQMKLETQMKKEAKRERLARRAANKAKKENAETRSKAQRAHSFVPLSERFQGYTDYANYIRAEFAAREEERTNQAKGGGGGENSNKSKPKKAKVYEMPPEMALLLRKFHKAINEKVDPDHSPRRLYDTKLRQWNVIKDQLPKSRIVQWPMTAIAHASGAKATAAGYVADFIWQVALQTILPEAAYPLLPRTIANAPSRLLNKTEESIGMFIPERVIAPTLGKSIEVAGQLYDNAEKRAQNATNWIMSGGPFGHA